MAAKGSNWIVGDGNGYGSLTSRFTIPALFCDVVSETACGAKKLLRSTGKAAWIAGTTCIVLFVPFIFATDREAQINEMEAQQATLLGSPAASSIA